MAMFNSFLYVYQRVNPPLKHGKTIPKTIARLGSQAYPGNQVKSERGLATRRMEECKFLLSGAHGAPGAPGAMGLNQLSSESLGLPFFWNHLEHFSIAKVWKKND